MSARINKRLKEVYQNAKKVSFDDSDKFILFSDCHRGNGSWADDFAHNENVFFHALDYYYNNGFTYIEIGDGDELWENSRFDDVKEAYSHIFWILSKFYKKKRLYLIWGNHNSRWSNPGECQKNLFQYYDERDRTYKPLFQDIEMYEGLQLQHLKTKHTIFLVHGHQADFANDVTRWFVRFFVRNFWKFLQLCGVKDPTSPAKNFKKRNKIEKKLEKWVIENKQILIAGHTHRSVFPIPGKPPYFNTGSCVHPRCIVGIEINDGSITLIKWYVNVKESNDSGTLFIDRKELAGPIGLQDFFNNI